MSNIKQWIEVHKPKAHYDDVRDFIMNQLRCLYNVYVWSVIRDGDKFKLVPSKKLATAQLFIVCENAWEDEDVEIEITNDDLITIITSFSKVKIKNL